MTIAHFLYGTSIILAVLQAFGVSSRDHLGWLAFAVFVLAALV